MGQRFPCNAAVETGCDKSFFFSPPCSGRMEGELGLPPPPPPPVYYWKGRREEKGGFPSWKSNAEIVKMEREGEKALFFRNLVQEKREERSFSLSAIISPKKNK